MAEMEALNAEAKAELESDEELEDEEAELQAAAQKKNKQKQKKGKKGKKGKQEIPDDLMLSDDDLEDQPQQQQKKGGKKGGKKGKKGKQDISADLMLSDDEEDDKPQPQKKGGKKGGKKGAKKAKQPPKGVSADMMLSDDEEDDKPQPQQQQQQQKKKGGKKGKKAKQPPKGISADMMLSDDDEEEEQQQKQEQKPKPQEKAAKAAAGDGQAEEQEKEEGQEQEAEKQQESGEPKPEGEAAEANAAEGDEQEGEGAKKKETKKEKKKKKMSKLAQALKAEREAFEAKERQRKQEEEERKRREEEERRRIEEEERREALRREKKRERERQRKARKRAEAKKKELERSEEEKQELARQKLAQMFGQDLNLAAASDNAGKNNQQRRKKQQEKKKKQQQEEEEAARQAELQRQREEEERKKKEQEEEEEPENWEDLLDESDLNALADDEEGGAGATNDDDEEEEGDVAAEETYTSRATAAGEKEHKTQEELHEERIEQTRQQLQRRREENEAKRTTEHLRSPICAVLGHVDTGKTKLLDKIRRSHVQSGEAGGITQQIGATYIPKDEIERQTGKVKRSGKFEIKVPGLLVIDTPGHESFSNLRTRGSSLCNMAVLVVDIMHGIEPQTAESLELLRKRRAPFVIALNKVDRLNGWIRTPNAPIQNALKKQKQAALQDFETRLDHVKLQFAEAGINTELYWKNKNIREYVNIVPTSAHTGEGIPDLLFLLVSLTQKMLAKALAFSEELECTVLEVKEVQGYGTTIDVILTNGVLREGDTIVLGGLEGPIVTTARSLLMPAPLKELRVKNQYVLHKEVRAAQGVKIAAKHLEKAVAGLPLFVAHSPEEVEVLKDEAERLLAETLNSIKTVEKGVCVQASTLGSLEALLEFLRTEKIPVSAVNIGPVHKRDVTRCTIQLQRDPKYACILAFDVPVDPDAKRFAAREGIRIFEAEIIYHLEDSFRQHMDEVKQRLRDQHRNIAVFPCRLSIVPGCVFNARDPIVVGVRVEEGLLRTGTPLSVPARGNIDIGVVSSMQFEHKEIDIAKKGQEVSIKIEPVSGEKKMVGRHFMETDELVSRISRESIDAVKNYFREDLAKDDWRLMARLKSVFGVI